MPIINTTQIVTLTAGGGTENLDVFGQANLYIIKGTATLTSNWTIQPIGSPLTGTEFTFRYEAEINLNGNTITVFGKQVPATLADKTHEIVAYYDGTDWEVNFKADMNEDGSVPLSVIEPNGYKALPLVSEVMVNGDMSPSIINTVQAEGTTQSILYYKCDPNSKTVHITGIIDANSIDETGVSGTLSLEVIQFLSGTTPNLALHLNIPLIIEYNIVTSGSIGQITPTFKSGYLQKTSASSTMYIIVPSSLLGTSVDARYSAYVNFTIHYV
ncbi:MAG: hypothetical protein WD512_13260 [Candidatus Paceibacterota bacterium]